MSRFLKIMIVLLTVAAMVTPVMAEDMLSLSGQMRVRAWSIDDGTTVSSATGNSTDSTSTWVDQRLRIGGKIAIAEGVSITFRTDVTESNWGGGNTYGSGRLGVQQWDRAHLDLAFDALSLRVGQQYIGMGKTYAFDAQSNGLSIKTNGPVAVTAFYMLADSNTTPAKAAGYKFDAAGATVPTAIADATDKNDGFYYGANVGFGADNFKANVFVVAEQGVTGKKTSKTTYATVATGSADEEVYLIGGNVELDLEAFKLIAELDYFTGEANDTDDAFGTQFLLDASVAAGEAVTVGGQFFYAMGDKTDTQYSFIGNGFNGYDPLFAHGSGLDNEAIKAGRPFTFFGDNSGVIAGRVYADAKVSDALKLGGSLSYLVPEEDSVVTADSAFTMAFGAKYAVMANTSLGVLVEYIDVDDTDVDAVLAAGVGLFVNF